MSLICGLCRFNGPISGIIALSGYMMNMPVPNHRKSIPVLLYHGLLDNRISFENAKKSFDSYLKGVNFTLEVNENMPHEVYLEEYEFIRNWVRKVINL